MLVNVDQSSSSMNEKALNVSGHLAADELSCYLAGSSTSTGMENKDAWDGSVSRNYHGAGPTYTV